MQHFSLDSRGWNGDNNKIRMGTGLKSVCVQYCSYFFMWLSSIFDFFQASALLNKKKERGDAQPCFYISHMWLIKHRLGGRLETQLLLFRLHCDELHGGKREMSDNEVKGRKLREHGVWERLRSSLASDKS